MQLPQANGGAAATPAGTDKRASGKRKSGKKSRLLQKAKKFAKQGRLGRGFEVDTETYNYFVQVLEIWQKNEFETAEEKETYLQNAFVQTQGHEVDYSSNQMTSRVIETLLPSASEEVLLRFALSFGESLRTLCADPFASHVLEKLLEISSTDKWAGSSPKITQWFQQTCRYVLNNFEDFTFDPYANHVMRKVCQCLTGFVEESGQSAVPQQNVHQKQGKKKSTSDVFGERIQNVKNQEIFADFYQRFLSWGQFFDLLKTEVTSCLVQVVLKSAVRVSPSVLASSAGLSLEDGIKKVCKVLGPELDLANSKHANLYTRMLEVCLSVGAEMGDEDERGRVWQHVFSTYFSARLSAIGIHEKGRFSLKKVIETCPAKEQFETIFDEILPTFGDLHKAGAISIFSAVSEACKKFGTRQSQFIQSLTEIIAVTDESESGENFIMTLARFGGKLEFKEDGSVKYLTQYVGTVILQNLLEFHKPLKIISSMLDMDGNSLSKLAMDPKGSHIVSAFFRSGTLGEKNKEKMLKKLKEYLLPLCLNKFGSRVIDTIWSWGSMKHKTTFASTLSPRVAQLNANQFGKFIAEKTFLQVYKRDTKLWVETVEKGGKRENEAELVLDELFSQGQGEEEEAEGKVKKSKKKKKAEKEQVEPEPVPEEEEEEEESTKPKKKKKNKKNKAEVEEPEMEVSNPTEEEEEETPKKKKKKRKHQDLDETVVEEALDDSMKDADQAEEAEEPERKKKKKKKDKKE